MHAQVYRKTLFHLCLLGIAGSILVGFYDVIFTDILEFFHLIFEVVEMALDKVVEHVFETELHETQLIVFYILLVLCGVLIYFVWKVLVQLFSGVGQNFHQEYSELKEAVVSDWQGMSMVHRIIFIVVFILVNYLASFLLF
jgi:hypothetical protein